MSRAKVSMQHTGEVGKSRYWCKIFSGFDVLNIIKIG